MPIVLRTAGYRFGFYASDADERPHVHVKKNGKHAKFWLEPNIEMEFNRRYRQHDVTQIRKLIEKHRSELLKAWHDFFGR
jgi:hypothetical protein